MRPEIIAAALSVLLSAGALSGCVAQGSSLTLRNDIEGMRLTQRRIPPVAGYRDYAGAVLADQDFTGMPSIRTATDPDRAAIHTALIEARGRLRASARAFDYDHRKLDTLRTHVLLRNAGDIPDESDLEEALNSGRAYYSFDLLADGGGFSYWAGDPDFRGIQGDEVAMAPGLTLQVRTPVVGLIEILRNEAVILKATAMQLSLPVQETGSYRVQVSITLGERTWPWIFSGPIRVRGG
ncbi:MAG TPA: hypothetical protein VI702_00130 [Nitrospiria bacterium]